MKLFLLARVLMVVVISSIAGCSIFANRSVQFLGATNELADLQTPAGFAISPREAGDIINRWHKYPQIFADLFYHDENNYYVVTCAGFKNGRACAVKLGTIINGQTGKVFNRETEMWEVVPEREQARLDTESDSPSD